MRVSVIVVSRDRAAALARCITGVAQLDHTDFELVVVSDRAGAAVVQARPDAARIKLTIFDEANISKARNLGIAQAAGDVLAFVDDDAVPEPTWLSRLVAPFDDPSVTATGGYVRARDGVRFEASATSVTRSGQRHHHAPNSPLPSGQVWHTEGTNMAFRAEALRRIGGFDEAFRYYLDETDVNLRLPGQTRLVPEAEVHHGFSESPRRHADRVPKTLFEIGASSAHFMQMHNKEAVTVGCAEFRATQRRRLLRHMVSGRLEPRAVEALLSTYDAGVADGLDRQPMRANFRLHAPRAFLPFRTSPPGKKCLFTGPWRDRSLLRSRAEAAALAGDRPTLVLFSPAARHLRVAFVLPGLWIHVGGQFGRGTHGNPRWHWASRKTRTAAERARLATIRGLPPDT